MLRILLTLIMSVMTSTMTSTVTLQPGDTAPDFSAVATDGSTISLHDYVGKSNVVLYFYPEDMTSGCTVEACKFRDDISQYKAANTVVLGVSMDDQQLHQQFTEKDKLNFPLLVDTSRTIIDAYGVPVNGTHAKRWTYLIGKDGKIIKIYQQVNPMNHSEELLKDIAAYNESHSK